jgi:putative tryptophan/tyrosine transport system substrate-binding protein
MHSHQWNRRDLFTLLGGAVSTWPAMASFVLGSIAARAQAPSRRPLIAVLAAAPQGAFLYYRSAFLQGLHELGYAEGRYVDLIERYADGFLDRLPALAEEVVHLRPAAILAQTSSVALSASRATATIPIVVATMADRLDMIGSDARPTGNVTGVLVNLEGLAGKQLQIASELISSPKKVGLLFNVGNPGIAFQRREFEDAAAAMSIKLVTAEVRSPDDLDTAFRRLTEADVGIVVIAQDAMLTGQRGRIAGLAAGVRMPVMAAFRIFAEEGAVITYGINPGENYRRAARYIDKILKGTKVGDLPVELPTKVEMVINLKSAKALGLAVPTTLLIQADHVFE